MHKRLGEIYAVEIFHKRNVHTRLNAHRVLDDTRLAVLELVGNLLAETPETLTSASLFDHLTAELFAGRLRQMLQDKRVAYAAIEILTNLLGELTRIRNDAHRLAADIGTLIFRMQTADKLIDRIDLDGTIRELAGLAERHSDRDSRRDKLIIAHARYFREYPACHVWRNGIHPLFIRILLGVFLLLRRLAPHRFEQFRRRPIVFGKGI